MAGDEKRKFDRVLKDGRITCQEVKYPLGTTPVIEVRMLDLSEGGVKVASTTSFPEGSTVQISIELPGWYQHTAQMFRFDDDKFTKPLTAVGKVARCAPSEGGSEFELGIMFVNIWEEHWSAMRKFIEKELVAQH